MNGHFRLLKPVIATLLSNAPADRLIRRTAREQWRLVALNLASSLVEAFSAGATLAVIFLSVETLSDPEALPVPWLRDMPPTTIFLTLLGLAVILQALQSISRFLNKLSVGYFAARCRALITACVHSQVLSFTYPCASSFKVGDLTDFANQGPEAIRNRIELTGGLLVGILLVLTYISVLIRLSPWLLLATALMGGLIAFVQSQLIPKLRTDSQEVSRISATINARVTEDFQGLRLLHSGGQLDAADLRLRGYMSELEKVLRGQSRRLAVINPLASFLPILVITGIASVSVILYDARGNEVLPRLVTFVLALQRLNDRLSMVAETFNRLGENYGRMGRLNQILDPGDKEFRRKSGHAFMGLSNSIRFDAVSLRYSPDLPLAINDISFTLPKGKMIALVGPSGAGKSSIADLLVGLYTPTEGKILVDGIPLEEIELATWQQRLGVVSQDTFLFNDSIVQNIAFGTPGATFSQVQEACAAAQAARFIESLPQGYETVVGERGYRLSGGQRQRLSLARAILRDPALLILDEATSALDSTSERLVQEAIERFEFNHTVLVIAHRLSTIVQADEILVIQDGAVLQSGKHQQLLSSCKLYSDLWHQQSQQSHVDPNEAMPL